MNGLGPRVIRGGQAAAGLAEQLPHQDLLVVDGDPYRDISVFRGDGGTIAAIMLGGRFVKNTL